jgi:hypothetical protein
MIGNIPTDRNKQGIKSHILTDKRGISLSVALSSTSTNDIMNVTDIINDAVIKRSTTSAAPAEAAGAFVSTTNQRKTHKHLSIDRLYRSNSMKNEIICNRYVRQYYKKENAVKR